MRENDRGRQGDSPDKEPGKQVPESRGRDKEKAMPPKIFAKEVGNPQETAIDLTEGERAPLFKGMAKVLASRGREIPPEPGIYYNVKGEQYTPKPHLEAEITAEELAAHQLPYDKLIIGSEDVSSGATGPAMVGLMTERMVTQEMVIDEGEEPVLCMGTETKWVTISRDETLGLVIEEEDAEVTLYPGTPDEEQVTEDEFGNRFVLKGSSLFVDQAPLLRRSELRAFSNLLDTLT